MTPQETSAVLAMIGTYDRREFTPTDVKAWHAAWDPALTFNGARHAVSEHYRTSTYWLMPAHLNRIAKARRDDRGQRNALPAADDKLVPMPAGFRDTYLEHRKVNEGRYDKDAPRVDDGYNHLTGRWDT